MALVLNCIMLPAHWKCSIFTASFSSFLKVWHTYTPPINLQRNNAYLSDPFHLLQNFGLNQIFSIWFWQFLYVRITYQVASCLQNLSSETNLKERLIVILVWYVRTEERAFKMAFRIFLWCSWIVKDFWGATQ